MRARFDRLPLPAVTLVVALCTVVFVAVGLLLGGWRPDAGQPFRPVVLLVVGAIPALVLIVPIARARRQLGGRAPHAALRQAVRTGVLPQDAPVSWIPYLERDADAAMQARVFAPMVFLGIGSSFVWTWVDGGFWGGESLNAGFLGTMFIVLAVALFIDGRLRPPRIRRLLDEFERRSPSDVRAAAAGV